MITRIMGGYTALHIGTVLAVIMLLFLAAPAYPQEPESQQAQVNEGRRGGEAGIPIGAGLAVGLAAVGAGIAVGIAGAAAIGAITQKPEVFGRSLVFVGLAEGIAIYGLIIAFMLMMGFGG